MALRVVFMGTPAFSVPTLAALAAAGHDIAAVYTQPPRKAGRRGLTLTRRRVAGDVRLEIGGADKGTIDGLKALGCFTEIIAFQLRVFVPHGEGVDAEAILTRIVGDGHPSIRSAA